jgi:hypothetical protein
MLTLLLSLLMLLVLLVLLVLLIPLLCLLSKNSSLYQFCMEELVLSFTSILKT